MGLQATCAGENINALIGALQGTQVTRSTARKRLRAGSLKAHFGLTVGPAIWTAPPLNFAVKSGSTGKK